MIISQHMLRQMTGSLSKHPTLNADSIRPTTRVSPILLIISIRNKYKINTNKYAKLIIVVQDREIPLFIGGQYYRCTALCNGDLMTLKRCETSSNYCATYTLRNTCEVVDSEDSVVFAGNKLAPCTTFPQVQC